MRKKRRETLRSYLYLAAEAGIANSNRVSGAYAVPLTYLKWNRSNFMIIKKIIHFLCYQPHKSKDIVPGRVYQRESGSGGSDNVERLSARDWPEACRIPTKMAALRSYPSLPQRHGCHPSSLSPPTALTQHVVSSAQTTSRAYTNCNHG